MTVEDPPFVKLPGLVAQRRFCLTTGKHKLLGSSFWASTAAVFAVSNLKCVDDSEATWPVVLNGAYLEVSGLSRAAFI